MIFTLTLNPAIDRELSVDAIWFNKVLRAIGRQDDCGGKGINVTRMLWSLGVESIALGFVAGKTGEQLDNRLQDVGIQTDFIWVKGESRTNISIVDNKNDRCIKINEPGPVIDEEDLERLKEKIKTRLHPGDWWVLAGSLPQGVPAGYYGELIGVIREAGAHVFLDTSSAALKESCKAVPLLIKPNAEEVQELTGMSVGTDEDIIKAGRAACRMGAVNVVVSLGHGGAFLINDECIWKAASPEIVEKNPTGAGDSMVAGIVWGLSEGKTLEESFCLGIACGAATAARSGTDVGSLAQVKELLQQVVLKTM